MWLRFFENVKVWTVFVSAKEFVQKCVSEFISFITSEASQKCAREKRKTINGSDLIWALSILGALRDMQFCLWSYLPISQDLTRMCAIWTFTCKICGRKKKFGPRALAAVSHVSHVVLQEVKAKKKSAPPQPGTGAQWLMIWGQIGEMLIFECNLTFGKDTQLQQ